ncbi:MAG: resuscitation-promoting factor RpfA [Frankiaceae bacterium]|nr:resuscitation-promoting factor RpfA [Frankiaceae bacterium]
MASSARTRLTRGVSLTATAVLAGGLLWLCRPSAVAGAGGPEASVVTATAWMGWLLAGYLALSVAVTALVSLARPARAGAAALPAVLSPPVVRRLVEAALRVGLTAVVLSGLPAEAFADSPHPRPVPARSDGRPPLSFSLDWPALAAGNDAPPAARRTTRPPAARRPLVAPLPRPAGPVTARDVVVRVGDSLWTIAARGLRPPATAARVAAEWPRWWAANRGVIGTDPDLIHPGQRLVAPTDQRSQP